MTKRVYIISLGATLFILAAAGISVGESSRYVNDINNVNENLFPEDSVPPSGDGGPGDGDSNKTDLVYPIEDRQGDHLTDTDDNPFSLKDPGVVQKSVEYDPETDRFIITETLDGRPVRPPQYMTFDEYLNYESEQSKR